MTHYVNYRAAVEGIFIRDQKVFVAKRAADCTVAPNQWNVPAGKVKYEETPDAAIVREMLEETKLDIESLSYARVHERAFKGENAAKEPTYRLVFSYAIDLSDNALEPDLDEEHSEGRWVSADELDTAEFAAMNAGLKALLKRVLADCV